MTDKTLTYKKFPSFEQASELTDVLNQNKIHFDIEDNTANVSDFILGQNSDNHIAVKIFPDDFTKVNSLLNENAARLVDTVDKDYHLFSFDTHELLEILSEPDKWHELDKQLAKKILSERGIPVTTELEKTLYQKRIKELSTKESGGSMWTITGYVLAFLGGFFGIAIGIHLWMAKRTLPDGTRTYIYTDTDRKHGEAIAILGICMFCLGIYLQVKLY